MGLGPGEGSEFGSLVSFLGFLVGILTPTAPKTRYHKFLPIGQGGARQQHAE